MDAKKRPRRKGVRTRPGKIIDTIIIRQVRRKRKLKKAISAAIFSMAFSAMFGGVVIGTMPEFGKGWNAGRILCMAGLGLMAAWMLGKAYLTKGGSHDKKKR